MDKYNENFSSLNQDKSIIVQPLQNCRNNTKMGKFLNWMDWKEPETICF